MTKLLIGGAVAALAFAAGPAGAQPAPPPPAGVAQGTAPMAAPAPAQRTRVMVMSNKVMTRADVTAHVQKLFARLDTNRDGYLTREEMDSFAKGMGAMHGDMGKRMGEHDMPAMDRSAMFDRLDANHDGMISRQEYMAAKPEIRERRMIVMRDGKAAGEAGAGMPGMPGMMRVHAMMMSGGFGAHLLAMADTNHDGRVSLAEAEAAALAHFDRADLNHDGKITPDERQQMHATMREHHGS